MSAGIERALSAMDKEQCPNCDGEGGYWDDQTGQPDEPQGGRMLACEQCHGEGWVVREPCIVCGAPITQGNYPWNNDEHDEGCPMIDHPGSLAVQAQALAERAAKEVAWPTCHHPRWINADGKCEHTDHEEVQE